MPGWLSRMAISKARRSVWRLTAPAHLHVAAVPSGFLIVEGIVFDVADDLLALQPLDELRDGLSGEDGVFARVFEIPSVARLAHEVHARAQ